MAAKVKIDAGVCGFISEVAADSADYQNVTFEVKSDCPKVGQYVEVLKQKMPIDAYGELASKEKSVIMSSAGQCCISCIVPCGIFKAMQVAAGLALAKDTHMNVEKA